MGTVAAGFLLMLVMHGAGGAFSMTSQGSYASKAECRKAAAAQPAPAAGFQYLCVSEADLERLQRASR